MIPEVEGNLCGPEPTGLNSHSHEKQGKDSDVSLVRVQEATTSDCGDEQNGDDSAARNHPGSRGIGPLGH